MNEKTARMDNMRKTVHESGCKKQLRQQKLRIPAPPTRTQIQKAEERIEAETDCNIFNLATPSRIPACFKNIPAEEIAYVVMNELEKDFKQRALLLFFPVKKRPYFTVVTLGFSERRELIASAIELAPGLIKLLFKLMKMSAEKKRKLKYGDLIKGRFTKDEYYPDTGNLLVVPAVDGYVPEADKGEDGIELMQLISDETIGILDKRLTTEDISRRLRVDMINQAIDGPRILSLMAKDMK